MDDIKDDIAHMVSGSDTETQTADEAEAPAGWSIPPQLIADPSSIASEAIRALRTRIMAQHVREGRRALAICTPSEGSGCSYVAINLAVATAQIGVKVALIDSDLRQPSIAENLGIAPEPGVSDYLADRTLQLDDVIRADIMPGLSIIPAGTLAPNPQELLSGDRFRTFVGQLMREFDLTIFDTTPANRCTDAQRVATVAGYSLIVARKHKSFVNDVSILSKLLRADRSVVVGSVLNVF